MSTVSEYTRLFFLKDLIVLGGETLQTITIQPNSKPEENTVETDDNEYLPQYERLLSSLPSKCKGLGTVLIHLSVQVTTSKLIIIMIKEQESIK